MIKKVVSTALVSLLLQVAIASVKANPIVPGQILFLREDIDATISYAGSVVQARVNGTYTFFFADTPLLEVTMYYPVPPNASSISVKYDEITPDWHWNETYYSTVIGDYLFINWTIYFMPVFPTNFTVSIHYEHPVPLIEGKYKFLYAFGTGKLANAKYCDANITTYISKDVALTEDDMDVYLVREDGILEPAIYATTSLDGVWQLRYTEENTLGTKDFLITIKKNDLPVGGIYIPMDKLSLLAPYIGLTILLAVAVVTVVYVKKRKRDTRINS